MARLTDDEFAGIFAGVITLLKEEQDHNMISINTMYKPKALKKKPIDKAPMDGSIPPGSCDGSWKRKALDEAAEWVEGPELSCPDLPYQNIHPRLSKHPRGTRFTAERLAALDKGLRDTELTDQERAVLLEILTRREYALAWEIEELGHIRHDIAPPYNIPTVPHNAWQARTIPIPQPLISKVVKVLQKRKDAGIYEEAHSPYRNAWFVVEKKNGGIRLVKSVTMLNSKTIRDAYLPPSCDEFAEKYSMCKMLSVVDFFSGYDQVPLSIFSRDLTTFASPIGLLRMTTLPQGATNSVAHFLRVVGRMLFDVAPEKCTGFFDDVAITGPTDRFDDEEVAPGIRRFVLEHLENIDAVLLNFELAGATASAEKSQWCKPAVTIVGYICGTNGRKPSEGKIVKILDWPACRNTTDVRAFLGITGYFRIWVAGYAIVSKPLTKLLSKNTPFVWGDDQQDAMDRMKELLTKAPCLIVLDYTSKEEIILKVDASGIGWGAVLGQIMKGVFHPARYESGAWRGAEERYDAGKKECLGVVSALRRMRNYLYGTHFILETDAKVLIAQLNDGFSSLPNAALTRWVAYIKMFDMEFRHVPGRKHTAADGLSRKMPSLSDEQDIDNEMEIDEYLNLQINISALGAPVDHSYPLRPAEHWSEDSQHIAQFLVYGEFPSTLHLPNTKEARAYFKKEASYFCVQHETLWRRPERNFLQRRVIDKLEARRNAIRDLHAKYGHRGRDSTYHRIAQQYWWKGMYRDIKEAVKCCPQCEKLGDRKVADPQLFTPGTDILVTWVIDVQFMPRQNGFIGIVEARCNVCGYLEAEAIRSTSSKEIARFLWRKIILQHGVPLEVKCDGGSENKGEVRAAGDMVGFKIIVGPSYYPQAQAHIESGHKPITKALRAMTDGGSSKTKWLILLPLVVWADRTSVREYGFSPYELVYSRRPILPIETVLPSWRVVNWTGIKDRDALIEARVRTFERRDEDIAKVAEFLTRKRKAAAERADQKNASRMRKEELKENDLVLLYDTPRHIDMSNANKLRYRWTGPYLIGKVLGLNRVRLKEPDGPMLKGQYPTERLKHFVQDTEGIWEAANSWEDDWAIPGRTARPRTLDQSDPEDDHPEVELEPDDDWRNKADKDELENEMSAQEDELQKEELQVILPSRQRGEFEEFKTFDNL